MGEIGDDDLGSLARLAEASSFQWGHVVERTSPPRKYYKKLLIVVVRGGTLEYVELLCLLYKKHEGHLKPKLTYRILLT